MLELEQKENDEIKALVDASDTLINVVENLVNYVHAKGHADDYKCGVKDTEKKILEKISNPK